MQAAAAAAATENPKELDAPEKPEETDDDDEKSPWEREAVVDLTDRLRIVVETFIQTQGTRLVCNPHLIERPKEKPRTYPNQYPVRTWEWNFLTWPNYCLQLFYEFINDPNLDYCNQPHHAEFEVPHPKRQSLLSHVEDLIAYYKRVHRRIHEIWLQHYRAFDAKIEQNTKPGTCSNSAYQRLLELYSPERAEICLRLDAGRVKEGDRIALDDYRNVCAFYVYKQPDSGGLWITRYLEDYGYALPDEAADLISRYNPYAFMEDHQTYSFRSIQKDDLQPPVQPKKRRR